MRLEFLQHKARHPLNVCDKMLYSVHWVLRKAPSFYLLNIHCWRLVFGLDWTYSLLVCDCGKQYNGNATLIVISQCISLWLCEIYNFPVMHYHLAICYETASSCCYALAPHCPSTLNYAYVYVYLATTTQYCLHLCHVWQLLAER